MFIRYAFLADSVSMDAIGKISAIGIFEVIFATKFPTIHRDMTLVARLAGASTEKGEHKLSVELRDDKANKLANVDQKVIFDSPPAMQGTVQAGLIMKFQDLPIQRPGQYEFVIFGDDRFLGRIVFTAHKVEIKKAGEA
jgi:hypothetical protein